MSTLSATYYPNLARDFVSLTKPRITLLVLVTAAGGLWLAPGSISAPEALLALTAITLGVGAANSLNCWLERDVDKHMSRTQSRPLPAGRMAPHTALIFGVVLGFCAVGLAFYVNWLTGFLGAIALFTYVGVYTPMKQWSPEALIVGAIPGALPPLMGWTSVTARVDVAALVLFAILFLWQIPHFIAIAILRQEEYVRAGIRVLPAVRGLHAAKLQAVLYAAALVPISVMLLPLGVAGPFYGISALLLGGLFVGMTLYGLCREVTKTWARNLFLTSLGYLSLLFLILVIDRI